MGLFPEDWRGFWQRWRGLSAGRRIFAASLTVGLFTLLVKIAGAAKVLVIASRFGLSDDVDAFLVAFLIPAFVADVVSIAIQASLIPTWIQVREREGEAAAQRLYSSILFCAVACLAGVAALVAIFSGALLPVLASGFPPAKLELARRLLNYLLPVLALSGVCATWRGMLNARGQFAFPAAVPLLTPITTVAVVLAGGARWGAMALAAGTLAGSFLETITLAWALRRDRAALWPRWFGLEPATREVLREYGPMLGATALLAAATLVDQAMAATLGAGAISALNYGTKIVTVALAIGPIALATAALPHFSEMAARAEWSCLRRTLATYFRFVLLGSAPALAVFIWFSEPIIRLLFERGAFRPEDTRLVATVQSYCVLQAPFMMLSTLVARVISSMRANHLLMWGAALWLASHVVCNLLFMRWLGVSGIALSTAVSATIYFAFVTGALLYLLRRVAPVKASTPAGVPAIQGVSE